jgi:hypothetical protein
MRENMGVYRGKTKDGEWVEGYYMQIIKPSHSILEISTEKLLNVLPETVGQWTGLTDKNGKRIFDNDVVRCWGGEYFNGIYEFNQTFVVKDAYDIVTLCEYEYVEYIGNIHDNPELVKE